jgi:hypothetical protein
MRNLGNYFGELTSREGKPEVNLAARWPKKEVKSIVRCLRSAFARCRFDHHPLRVNPRTTGQAMGNRLASFFAGQLDRQLRHYRIEACAGQGYPDRRLRHTGKNRSYALELKATRSFEPKSTNRVILTCSSGKLQRHFAAPINHLLVTVFFRKRGRDVWIQDFRLDFLEPWSKVNVRLEASVSQHLLAHGKHASFWRRAA